MKKFFFTIILVSAALFILLFAGSVAEDAKPLAEMEFKGHRYALYNLDQRWPQSKKFCEKLGGHLATISSAEENAALYKFITEAGYSDAYFGFTDEAKEGTFVWVTGEPVTYTNWHSGEPNNESYGEDYAMFYWKFTDGTWNDGDFGGYTELGGKNFICEWDGIVSSGEYLVYVVDENGDPLEGAAVTFGDQTGKTNADGNVYFDMYTYDTPTLTVTLDGYLEWSSKNSNWQKSSTLMDTIILYPESVGKLKLKTAKYSFKKDLSSSTNILTNTKKVSLGNNISIAADMSFGNFYVSVQAMDTKNLKGYQLYQGYKMVAESADGFFALNTKDFSKGANCFIRVTDQDGHYADTHVNLTFTVAELNKETSINLSSSAVTLAIKDDVPFIGGSKLNLKIPFNCPVSFYNDNNKLRIGLNLNVAHGKDDKEKLDDAKKLVSELGQVKKALTNMTKTQKNKLKSLMSTKNKAKFIEGWKDVEVNFIGYLEADWGSNKASGALLLELKADLFQAEYNTLVYVPVTVQFKVSGEAQAGLKVALDLSTLTLNAGLNVAPALKVTAFGGIGVSTLVGIGAYGSAKLDSDIDILPKPRVNKVDFTGELGLKAYMGFLEYTKAFAYNTWHLYTGNTSRGEDLAQVGVEGEEWSLYSQLSDGMYDASRYQKTNLGYLNDEQDHMGKEARTNEELKSRSDDLKTEFLSLIQNTYRNAQPVMVSTADALYAAFLKADAGSERVYAMVSKYDGEQWQTAVATSGDDVMDSVPHLLVDGKGNIWLSYARTVNGYDSSSMLSYARNQQIVTGRIDPDTLAFTETKVYSGNGYAHMHDMVLVNGEPTLAWVVSEVTDDNSVLWSKNSVVYSASCVDGQWQEAKAEYTMDHVTMDLVAGEADGRLSIACVVDGDNSYETGSDHAVVLISDATLTQVADSCSGKVSFTQLPGTDQSVFIWNEGNFFKTSDGSSLEINGLTSEYCIVGNSVYFSIPTESGAELCMTKYENGKWSEPVVLTEGEGYFEGINVATMNGHDYVMGLYANVSIEEESVIDRKDLVWTKVSAVSDLRIKDVSYSQVGLKAGDEVPVTLEVSNAGDHDVSSIDVYVDGEQTSTEAVALPIGGSVKLTLKLTCPEDLTKFNVTVRETGRTDYTMEDNAAEVALGYADVVVQLQNQRIGKRNMLYAIITNEGIGMGAGTLTVTLDDGTVLINQYFYNIRPGDVMQASLEVNWDHDVDVTASFDCETEDLNNFNNDDSMQIVYARGHWKITPADMVLPNGLLTIEEEAFCESRMYSVTIPGSVQSIGARAFADCGNLVQIEIPASVTQIAPNAFEGVNNLVIFCKEGSAAEAFAKEHGMEYATE